MQEIPLVNEKKFVRGTSEVPSRGEIYLIVTEAIELLWCHYVSVHMISSILPTGKFVKLQPKFRFFIYCFSEKFECSGFVMVHHCKCSFVFWFFI